MIWWTWPWATSTNCCPFASAPVFTPLPGLCSFSLTPSPLVPPKKPPMNIFAIDTNPVIAGTQLHPKHTVKMILESAQMLANALGRAYGSGLYPLYTKRVVTTPYHLAWLVQPTWPALAAFTFGYRIFGFDWLGRLPFSEKGYAHHPCTVWVRQSPDNLAWLLTHGLALCQEYRRLYGKRHSLYLELWGLYRYLRGTGLGEWKRVGQFARAMPDDLKFDRGLSDTEAYRLYIYREKAWYGKGWKRPVPQWYEQCKLS